MQSKNKNKISLWQEKPLRMVLGSLNIYDSTSHEQLRTFGQMFIETLNNEHDHKEENKQWCIGSVIKDFDRKKVAYQFVFEKNNKDKIFMVSTSSQKNGLFLSDKCQKPNNFESAIQYGSDETCDYVWFVKPDLQLLWCEMAAKLDADIVFRDYFESGF